MAPDVRITKQGDIASNKGWYQPPFSVSYSRNVFMNFHERPGMKHHGKSRWTLITCDLSHDKWRCCERMPKSATHAAGCKHGVILAAKRAAGYDNRGHKKK